MLDLLTGRAALEHHLRREVYAAPERVDAALLEHHYRASHTSQARAALAAYLRGDLWHDVSEELARLRVPVWIAWGRQAKQPPVDQADLWLRHLPQGELDVFEGTGALPQAETPALFSRALERFLAKLPGQEAFPWERRASGRGLIYSSLVAGGTPALQGFPYGSGCCFQENSSILGQHGRSSASGRALRRPRAFEHLLDARAIRRDCVAFQAQALVRERPVLACCSVSIQALDGGAGNQRVRQ